MSSRLILAVAAAGRTLIAAPVQNLDLHVQETNLISGVIEFLFILIIRLPLALFSGANIPW